MVVNISFQSFQDPEVAKKWAGVIKKLAPDSEVTYKFTHVCGTHEQVISRYGVRSLLPSNVEIIAGPGCPVCVVPARDIDEAIALAQEDVIMTTFGDMSRVPGTEKSLLDIKTEGADVRIVYGPNDATKIARENPDRNVVFFAIGFETTAAIVAEELLTNPPENFSMLCSHRTIPAVMNLLMGVGELQIDGFICPGHVSTIIGMHPYKFLTDAYRLPAVIAGFEPVDILISIAYLLKQIKEKKPQVINEYKRGVAPEGNLIAQRKIDEVFNLATVHWRGIGRVPEGGYTLKIEKYDARKKFSIQVKKPQDIKPGCICHLIMLGKMTPNQCQLFGTDCQPSHPYGPCMVSREGTCNIWHKYGSLNFI
ncbi:MAG: hydrogenase formation protein HypD [Candidatus Helarchaeota archaeon]